MKNVKVIIWGLGAMGGGIAKMLTKKQGVDIVGAIGIRVDSLKEYLSREEVKDSFSEKEKEFLISQWENLKTPFYYEYTEGWKALLDSQYLPTLMTLLVVILGTLVAGIFSDECSWKADSIFFSSKLGRNKAVLSKIGAGFLITTVLYWASILLFTIIILGALGVGRSEERRVGKECGS